MTHHMVFIHALTMIGSKLRGCMWNMYVKSKQEGEAFHDVFLQLSYSFQSDLQLGDPKSILHETKACAGLIWMLMQGTSTLLGTL